GAKPAWMSEKYPEILRVNRDRTQNLHGQRHNHCFTSPVYREKSQKINRMLAERYKDNKSLIMWHISNEFGGECHCEKCQAAFRDFLRNKYDNDIEKLNDAWWTGFWSHRFNNFEQIESPSELGEMFVHGHNLDWKRFVTHQTIDFYKNEIKPLREITPDIPCTTNFMGNYPHMGLFTGLDYSKFVKEVDIVSWDSYPAWHNDFEKPYDLACNVSFVNDYYRSLKGGQSFLIMENTPSLVNWHNVNKLKRPKVHFLSSMQSLAHGADSVLYFQWRKGRGASEKFHGAVVDHVGNENTRVFKEVTEVGCALEKLKDIQRAEKDSKAAVIYDIENRWAIDDLQGLKTFSDGDGSDKKGYEHICQEQYRGFWQNGISCDVIGSEDDFSKYKIISAPMLYMIKPNVAERLKEFVKNGGTLVTGFFSGIVNENDLCFLGGFPGPLKDLTGIWAEEIDSLYDGEYNSVVLNDKLNLSSSEYRVKDYCDLIHAETAEVLGTYGSDFYKGMPALTVNNYGQGKCYYVAARTERDFNNDFYIKLAEELDIKSVIEGKLPEGVTAQERTNENGSFIFILNFNEEEKSLDLGSREYINMLTQKKVTGTIKLENYDALVLKEI
ncbi:MAG: beta-galactosidase, partial [Clostridium sp.]|nr:beta-galactosidase [Clostridium sp.]